MSDSACSAFIGLGVAAGVDGGHEGFIQIRLVPALDGGHPAMPDPETADRRLSTERIRRSNINISSGRPGGHRATMRQRGTRFSAHFGRATLSHEPRRTGAASENVRQAMVPMRKKAPRQASLDEVRITREGGIAVIEHADPNVSVSRVSIGPLLKTMSDAAVLDLFNRMIEAQEKIAAGYDRVAVEIPPGRPQIRFSESSGQWVPRGRILRCQIEDDEGGETTVYIDDRKLDLGEFGRLLNFYAGWGMRIAFVPADEVTEQPEIEVRDPPLKDENRE